MRVPHPALAQEGNCFLQLDFEIAELHCLAELCFKLFGYSALGEKLNAGIDVHCDLAAQTLHLPYEEVLAGKSGKYKNDRDRSKPGNFGFPGGMGPDKFVLFSRKGYGVKFTRAEAQALKATWLATYPEMGEYLGWISGMLGKKREKFLHVHPITGFVRGGCGYSDGANHGFQHLMAYAAKDASWAVRRACCDPRSPMFGWGAWNSVHDELLLEGPIEGSHEAALECQRLMETAFNRWVPNFPTICEPILCDRWSKRAKQVKDSEGRIQVWRG